MKIMKNSNDSSKLGWRYHIEISKTIAFCLWCPWLHPSKPLIYLWIK